MKIRLGASEDQDIIPRDIRFGIIDNPVRYWFEGDLMKTATIDGLSVFLPEGERFFIKSLRHYAPQLQDKELAAGITGYSVQEALHTREHLDYNRSLTALGYDVEKMEKPIRKLFEAKKDPLLRVAVTCAIEHLTATISTATLRDPGIFKSADPRYRKLWMWHALEELEHKAVALEVLEAATKDMPAWKRYFLRIHGMNDIIIPFVFLFCRNVLIYARNDGEKTGARFWWRFLRAMFGSPGYWRRCMPLFMKYYIPGFTPQNRDDDELIRKGRAWLEKEMPELYQLTTGHAG